jgi:hypothetical protein
MLTGLRDTIGVVRLRAAGPERVTTRMLTERRLTALEARPRSLPPAAVLVARRLATRTATVRAGAPPADAAWESAIGAALDEVARRAARPEEAEAADAVVFGDAAELLACLAHDLCRGVAATRWWWRFVLPGLPPADRALAGLLVREAPLVPAAVARLGSRRAATVVGSLAPGEALAVLGAVARAYRVDLEWRAAPAGGPRTAGPTAVSPAGAAEVPGPRRAAARERVAGGQEPPPPPWRAWLPAGGVTASLAPSAEALLGLALALHHAPALARSRRFHEQARAWWAASAPEPTPAGPAAAGGSLPARATASAPLPVEPDGEDVPVIAPPRPARPWRWRAARRPRGSRRGAPPPAPPGRGGAARPRPHRRP